MEQLHNVDWTRPLPSISGLASTCQALVCHGRFCLCHLSLLHTASSADGVPTASVADGLSESLKLAGLRPQDVISLRVYYCYDIFTKEAARELLHAALREWTALQGMPPAAVLVPVTAVGSTPDADAAVHMVMLAMSVSVD